MRKTTAFNQPIDLTADEATASEEMVIDAEGCAWLRLQANGWWAYITRGDNGDAELGFDHRPVLPTEYEPYRGVDVVTERLLRRALLEFGLGSTYRN